MKQNKRIGKAVRRIGCVLLTIVLCAAIVLGVVISRNNSQNKTFKETFYSLASEKVADDLRIVHLSDLHATAYENLASRVEKLGPDLIVLTGDMVDKETSDVSGVVKLCEQLAQLAPTYYVYGNHERQRQYGMELMEEEIKTMTKDQLVLDEAIELQSAEDEMRAQMLEVLRQFGVEVTEEELAALPQKEPEQETEEGNIFRTAADTLRDQLEAAGVHVLLNEQDTIQVGNTTVDVYGVLTSSSAAFYEYASETFFQYAYQDDDNFKLMLIHEPYLMDVISGEDWGDLILCGHTHGGVIRLPYVGGLYEELYGFLPEFLNEGKVLGRYSVQGIPMIISGGLTNQELRINNQPELVIIDVNHY